MITLERAILGCGSPVLVYNNSLSPTHKFLNQARAWFLKIDPVRIVGMRVCVCVCVCVSAPEVINN